MVALTVLSSTLVF